MRAPQWQLMTLRSGQRPGVDSVRGVRPGRNRGDVACLAPERRREVRARRVRSADEEDSPGAISADWCDVGQRVVNQMEVVRRWSPCGSTADNEPCASSTLTWWASKLDGIASLWASSEGDASLAAQDVDDLQPRRIGQRAIDRPRGAQAPQFAQCSLPQS